LPEAYTPLQRPLKRKRAPDFSGAPALTVLVVCDLAFQCRLGACRNLAGGVSGVYLDRPDPPTWLGLSDEQYWYMITLIIMILLFWIAMNLFNSRSGRALGAIRDNEIAAAAMGKDITSRHRQVFIIGSAVIGIAGAMLTTLDGQFTPGSYIPLRFTFLIWVMVIIGGSGNNLVRLQIHAVTTSRARWFRILCICANNGFSQSEMSEKERF